MKKNIGCIPFILGIILLFLLQEVSGGYFFGIAFIILAAYQFGRGVK